MTSHRAVESSSLQKVTDLLNKVTALRATSFEAQRAPSLSTPALVVSLTFDDSKTENVTFGRTAEGATASRADEPGTAVLDGQAFDDVLTALDEVK